MATDVNAAARLDRLPLGPFHRRVLRLVGMGMFFDSFDNSMMAGVLAALVSSGVSTMALNATFISATFAGLTIGAATAGLLPIRLEMAEIERIASSLARSNASTTTVDLERCVIDVPGLAPIRFAIADDRRLPLLEGLDQLDFMLRSAAEIDEFETQDAAARPWAYARVS
jgi:3-isopropylmalate dehydratase small subunit